MGRRSGHVGGVYVGDAVVFWGWRALGLSTRAAACLSRAGVRVEWAATMTDEDLLDLRNVGVGLLAEIRARIPYQPAPRASDVLDAPWTVIA